MEHTHFWVFLLSALFYCKLWKLFFSLIAWNIVSYFIWDYKVRAPSRKGFKVCIVGAGFSGIATAIKLKEAGVEYEVFEAASDIGGVWFSNPYPGCACDVMSSLYSLSFEPNPFWTGSHASREEIWNYMREIVMKHELNIHLNSKVECIRWDNKRKDYTVTMSTGVKHYFNVVVHGVGPLREPVMPDIDGCADFQGECFHSSKWKANFDLAGKRVGVIGTGASAVQIVPAICKEVDQLYVFQRTPCWVGPRNEYRHPHFLKILFRHVPGVLYAHRLLLFALNELIYFVVFRNALLAKLLLRVFKRKIKNQVKDPSLAQKLTPSYMPGCKRIASSDDYLPSFNRQNVHLVTSKIDKVTKSGIQTIDGVESKLDLIVYATGFSPLHSFRQSLQIYNGDGLLLNDVVKDCPSAFLGITIPRFPNFFIVFGPNTGLGHSSVLWMMECQVEYIVKCIKWMLAENIRALHPKQESLDRYQEYVDQKLKCHVFGSSGCVSWYLNERGKNYVLWPGHLLHYWWMTRSLNTGCYVAEK